MITDFTQRWRGRKSFFVREDRLFRPRLLEVGEIDEESAKTYVVNTHYSKSYPSARRRFGLFLRGRLIGAAIFSHPMAEEVLTNYFGGKGRDSLELGRFVIDDCEEAGFNCESWFFARCRDELRKEGFRGIVSFSDDLARSDEHGNICFQGHVGVFYGAAGSIYTGRASKKYIYLLPDGTSITQRTVSKIRNSESGAGYASRVLESFGADPYPADKSKRVAWCEFWLAKLTRKVKHPGNHRYLFPLQKNLNLPPSLPYPKIKYRDLQMQLPLMS